MASPIIAAIRQRRDLKESLLHTAQELAHRASIYGVVRVSYSYLAQKCHCSRRTVLRHVQRLVDLGIVRKTVLWIRATTARSTRMPSGLPGTALAPGGSDKTTSTLPPQEREKSGALREELEKQKKGLRFWTPGTEQWHKTGEEITRLEGLLAHGEAGA